MTLNDPPPEELEVVVEDVQAADPGMSFLLKQRNNSPFGGPVLISLQVTIGPNGVGAQPEPLFTYNSYLFVQQTVTDNAMTVIMPFGASDWQEKVTADDFVNAKIEVAVFDKATAGVIRLGDLPNPVAKGSTSELLLKRQIKSGYFEVVVKDN